MELEHLFQQSGFFMTLQLFMGALLFPSMIGRTDIYRRFIRAAASNVVTFGPMALLMYVLYEVSRLS